MQKKVHTAAAVFLLLCLLVGCGGLPLDTAALPTDTADAVAETAASQPLATVLTASDFQENGVFLRFRVLLDTAAAAGVPTPDCALFGGDYNIQTEQDADKNVQTIRNKLTGVFPDFDPEAAIFVQGNHDNMTEALSQTGAYDFGTFTVYVINEDDFPSGQDTASVEAAVRDLDKFLSDLVNNGDFRPVLVATHVPLHRNARCDNGCAKYLVNVLNQYGQKLDILCFFGHNHSDTYDDNIGGSVNLFRAGERMQVQNPDTEYTQTDGNFSAIQLNFTYLNYGYVGYSENTAGGGSTNVLTLGVLEIYPDRIEIIRYTTEGEYCRDSIPLQNRPAADKAA